MNKKNIFLLFFVSILFLSGCAQKPEKSPRQGEKPMPIDLPNQQTTQDKVENQKFEPFVVELEQEFMLQKNQSAKIEAEDFEVKIKDFYNSPCPSGDQCIWSGVGIALEYSFQGEKTKGIDLVQVFGFQATIIETDHESFAKLKITKL